MPTFINHFPCTMKVVFKVDYSDLEQYIKKVTGKSFSIPACLECGNDTEHEIEIGDHPEWLDEKNKKACEDFLFGSAKNVPNYSLNWLMETMLLHNLIEKGTYIISVSW